MIKVIIAGGRYFDDKKLLKSKCDNIFTNLSNDQVEIVSGGALGADTLGEWYAFENKMSCQVFKANWDVLGKAAGIIRNGVMAKYSDALIAFWDGESRGTKHMIDTAKKEGLKVRVIRYD